MNRLVDSLAEAWAARDDSAVEGNMGLYFSETQALKNDFRAPDVFVVVDVPRRERKRWVVWEEQGRGPEVVIELVSESTERVDAGARRAPRSIGGQTPKPRSRACARSSRADRSEPDTKRG